ncbi:hypothetical protein Q5424_04555 [Conexibacter sp. JD483]|uniref:hypothetical protein n=1 Tax=unclassified Conexibacter TaxID=2627773 RepID=UPI0027271BC4|nr:MULTISPECIES: hypothetical protein [unclassified Conexibacter]MDO8184370.1 hypothetical protein [Conexibacter sp. CPCC 205706]MDO8197676.1 hypothetical protein [Conexibacter sp. CPCC 205762]MDR9368339.1 hypothetical protein [Conexibacter sp. JD483]
MNPLAVLAAAPAVPYDKAGRYVAAAFIVLFAIVLIYVAIMATKLQRLERDLGDINRELDRRQREQAESADGVGPAVGAATAAAAQENAS